MSLLVIYGLLFASVNALSVALTGDRELASTDVKTASGALAFLLNWRFIAAMVLAVGARLLFLAMQSACLSVPALARNATTVASLVSAVSFPVIMVTNALMLDERPTARQYIATVLIMAGVLLATNRDHS